MAFSSRLPDMRSRPIRDKASDQKPQPMRQSQGATGSGARPGPAVTEIPADFENMGLAALRPLVREVLGRDVTSRAEALDLIRAVKASRAAPRAAPPDAPAPQA